MIYPEDFINKIIWGDALSVMRELPDNSIDLIFTDPPYPKEYFHTYQYLADQAPRLMKRGASLMMIVPHYSLPDVIKEFDGRLKYRWAMCLNQFSGTHSRMAMGIEVMWKCMLWYVKDAYPSGRGFLRDGVEITGKDGQKKSRHKWEQDVSWAEYYIQRLTKEGDTVLDPYVGSGTVAVVCKKLGRNYIGIDYEKTAVETSIERLRE